MKILKDIWSILLPTYKRKAAILLVFVLIGGMFESVGLGMIIPLIGLMTAPDKILQHPKLQPILQLIGNPSPDSMFFLTLASFVVIYFVIAIYRLWLSWYQTSFIIGLNMSTASRLFESYIFQPWSFHLKRHSSELIQNVNREVDLLTQYGFTGAISLIRDGIMIVIVLFICVSVAPIVTLSVIGFLTPIFFGFQWLSKLRVRLWAKKRQVEESERLKCLQDSFGAVKELQILGCQDLFIKRYSHHCDNLLHIGRLQSFMRQLPKPILEFSAIACIILIIIIMWYQGKALAEMAPILGLFAVAILRIIPSLQKILNSIHGIRYVAPSINMLVEELKKVQIVESKGTQKCLIPKINDFIEFRGVNFRYDEGKKSVLKSIDLKMSKGSFTVVVGESGAGKSTLVHLLLGLLNPTSGGVYVDGVNIQNSIKSWQKQIGYVGQQVVLVDDTLRRNIALGVPDEDIDNEQVEKVIKEAQLTDFVSASSEGLEVKLGEKGARISVGEQQRVGIARALYANKSVLILDEITSALDERTEKSIALLLNQLKTQATIIMITHRLSLISGCDQVVRVLGGGIKVEMPEGGG